MAILSKVCKPDNFESHNSLKLSFTNVENQNVYLTLKGGCTKGGNGIFFLQKKVTLFLQ